MRQGRTYRRCTACGRALASSRCSCGAGRSTWTYVVDVGGQGRHRVQRKRGGFPTKSAALAAMAKVQLDVASGSWVEPSHCTLGQYLQEQWLPSMRGQVRGSTWIAYELNVRLHVMPQLGNIPLQQLTRARLKQLYQSLAGDGGPASKRPLSAKTIHNVHLTLRKALADAVDERLVARNVAERAHRIPRGHQEMKTWTGKQLALFLRHVGLDRYFALWRVAAMTGMRRGELLGQRWRDIDLDAGRLSVVQQRVRGADGRLQYGPPKTSRGRRSITLDNVTVTALGSHRAAQAADRLAFGPGYCDDGLVFARGDGTPLDPDTISQTFDRHAREAGLPRIRFHDLRHTHASLYLAAGIHPKVVQERLGHSSISVTLDTYSHAVPALQEDAAARVAAIVDVAV